MNWFGKRWVLAVLGALAVLMPSSIQAACCYFPAKNADILQPAQKVFISWDPEGKIETFTVQPKFEGNALDFGKVIPTPSQPKLHEMPRDFFKHLAVYSIMKRREFPHSSLLPAPVFNSYYGAGRAASLQPAESKTGDEKTRKPAVIVLEQGVVGSLDYKIIEANRADALF